MFVGDLSNVLSTHWSAEANQKTHSFWSHDQLTLHLENTLEVAGMSLEEVSEAGTSSNDTQGGFPAPPWAGLKMSPL